MFMKQLLVRFVGAYFTLRCMWYSRSDCFSTKYVVEGTCVLEKLSLEQHLLLIIKLPLKVLAKPLSFLEFIIISNSLNSVPADVVTLRSCDFFFYSLLFCRLLRTLVRHLLRLRLPFTASVSPSPAAMSNLWRRVIEITLLCVFKSMFEL